MTTKLFDHLQKKLGQSFARRLKFDEGQRLNLARLRVEFPALFYEANLRLGMYDLLFRFSDRRKGLHYYYAKIALNEDGSVSHDFGLPNIGKDPRKCQIVSCQEAIAMAVRHGFAPGHVSPEFAYSPDLDSFIWILWGGPTGATDRIHGVPLRSARGYRKLDLNANTGEIVRVYDECIAL